MFAEPEVVLRTYVNLIDEARAIVFQLSPECDVSSQRLRDELTMAVARARPKSKLVSWFLDDATVAGIIDRVAVEVTGE